MAQQDGPRQSGADGDDELTRISGIGPGVARRLQAAGFRRFEEVARATPAALAGALAGVPAASAQRVEEQDWIGQAARLAAERPAPPHDRPEPVTFGDVVVVDLEGEPLSALRRRNGFIVRGSLTAAPVGAAPAGVVRIDVEEIGGPPARPIGEARLATSVDAPSTRSWEIVIPSGTLAGQTSASGSGIHRLVLRFSPASRGARPAFHVVGEFLVL